MAEEPTQSPFVNEWLAVSLRLTAFPASPLTEITSNRWADLVGDEPEQLTFKRTSHEYQAVGLIEIGQLILTTNPVVIEWRVVPKNIDQIPLEGFPFPNIGALDQMLDPFSSLMFRWLDKYCPDLRRLAFGAELLLPTEDRNATYERLARYLSVNLDSNSSDLSYQINRKRDTRTGIPNLRINRLSKWKSIKVSIGSQIVGQPFELPGLDRHACHLELDINTSPDFQGTLTHDDLKPVFQELITFGREIMDKGDIP